MTYGRHLNEYVIPDPRCRCEAAAGGISRKSLRLSRRMDWPRSAGKGRYLKSQPFFFYETIWNQATPEMDRHSSFDGPMASAKIHRYPQIGRTTSHTHVHIHTNFNETKRNALNF